MTTRPEGRQDALLSALAQLGDRLVAIDAEIRLAEAALGQAIADARSQGVTAAQIAEATGLSRAWLYRRWPDQMRR